MRMRSLWIAAVLAGCSNGSSAVDMLVPSADLATPANDLAAPAADLATPEDLAAPVADLAVAPDDLSGALEAITFTYTPQWGGVTSVNVIGAFGTSTDWDPAHPFLSLTKSGDTWTGTAMLAHGTYAYLFDVAGDADAPSTFTRYSLDPLNTDFAECPTGSPTFSATVAQPCSQVTSPQPAAASTYELKGQVVYDGSAKKGYLAVLERNETGSHHFFANRIDTDATGHFALNVTAGAYRIQILHPTYYTMTDAARIPTTYDALLRVIGTNLEVSSTITIAPAAEVSFKGYGAMAPQPVDGGEALPQTFVVSLTGSPGYTTARAEVYGTATRVGDPWWTGPFGTQTHVVFDGGFNTKATTLSPVPGTRYFWGQNVMTARVDAGTGSVVWDGQSMVFPITWR